MSKASETYNTICDELSEKHKAAISKMFGMPCLKINSKAFAGLFKDEMVFKLTGDERKEALALSGAKLFDPSGMKRPMKEWVQVPLKYADQWKGFALSSMKYVMKK